MTLLTNEKQLKKRYIMTEQFYQSVKNDMEKNRQKKVWSKKDIQLILQAYENEGDYTEVHKTKLYNQYGSVYCYLIMIMARHEDKLKIEEYYI